jgi:uncharacterized protein (DUF488 family)
MENTVIKKKLYTIGFTKKKAKIFFDLLQTNNIELLIDIRLNNNGQLAGFTKKDDLEYFLSLFNIKYEYWKELAPTKEIREKSRITNDWDEYKYSYLKLIKDRKVFEKIDYKKIWTNNTVFLCSEQSPTTCHRRIVVEELTKRLDMEIVHL